MFLRLQLWLNGYLLPARDMLCLSLEMHEGRIQSAIHSLNQSNVGWENHPPLLRSVSDLTEIPLT